MSRGFNLFCLLSLSVAVFAAPDVKVKNLRVFYGEDEFVVKGIAYSPSPVEKIYINQNEGDKYCTPRTMYDWLTTQPITLSACRSEDYFDASPFPAPGPQDGFTQVWRRDLPLLKEAGFNMIRFYHAWPITKAAIQQNSIFTDKTVIGSDHVPFMDMALEYGLKVCFPLFAEQGDLDFYDANRVNHINTANEYLIDEVGNHEALFMFSVGNEINLFNPRDYEQINGIVSHARQYLKKKWNREVLFGTAVLSAPEQLGDIINNLHGDVGLINAGYGDWRTLFDNNYLQYYLCNASKPFLLGEIGFHNNGHDGLGQQDFWEIRFQWSAQYKTKGVIGGFLFSWVEEHWKTTADIHMGIYQQIAGANDSWVSQLIKKEDPATFGVYNMPSLLKALKEDLYALDSPKKYSTAPNNYCNPPPPIPPDEIPFEPPATTPTALPDPIAYYSFDAKSGSTIPDLTDHKYDITLIQNPNISSSSCVKGQCLELVAQHDDIKVSQSATIDKLNSLTGDMSFSVWLFLSYRSAEVKILSSKTMWNDKEGFELLIVPSEDTIKFIGASDHVASFKMKVHMPIKEWWHLAVTVHNNEVTPYFNGTQFRPAYVELYPPLATTRPMYLGSKNNSDNFYWGFMDELFIFNSVIGADQIQKFANRDELPTVATSGTPLSTWSTSTTSTFTKKTPSSSSSNPSTSTILPNGDGSTKVTDVETKTPTTADSNVASNAASNTTVSKPATEIPTKPASTGCRTTIAVLLVVVALSMTF